MKKTAIGFVFILTIFSLQAFAQTDADRDAIKRAALNYAEGWYEGNAERMERSLRDAVGGAFAQAGIASVAVESACFGMTGGAELVPEVAAKFLTAEHLTAVHDVVTALAGASAGAAAR